jgi:hypothetical protein
MPYLPNFPSCFAMPAALRPLGMTQIVTFARQFYAYVFLLPCTKVAKAMNGKGFVVFMARCGSASQNLARKLL